MPQDLDKETKALWESSLGTFNSYPKELVVFFISRIRSLERIESDISHSENSSTVQ